MRPIAEDLTSPHTAEPIDTIVVHTRLEDGRQICIRAVRPDDKPRMRQGIDQLSQQSRYLRFFTAAPNMPERVIERLVAVDGHRHLAWGAILTGDPEPMAIGAVHAMRTAAPGERAEFAIGVLDQFHGQGLARMLCAVLLIHCRVEGIAALDAQTLSDNRAATALLRTLGAERRSSAQGVSEWTLDTAIALETLRRSAEPAGLGAVFESFSRYL